MSAGENDFTRAEPQQQLLAAIAEKLTAGSLVVTLPGLLDAVKDNVATDIPSAGSRRRPRSRTPTSHASSARADPRRRIRVRRLVHEAGYVLHPDLDAIRELGESVFADPDEAATSDR